VLDLAREPRPRGTPLVVVAPSGARSPLRPETTAVELTMPGFYEVRPSAGGPPLAVAAVNVDRAESDLAAMDPEELAAAVTRGGAAEASAVDGGVSPAEEEGGQAIWRYLLGAALVLLAAETVLSNRLNVPGRAVRVP